MSRRKLTEQDIELIETLRKHCIAEEIVSHMPSGIGVATIQAYLDANPLGEQSKIAPSKSKERKNYVVMTEKDSVLSDAIEIHRTKEMTEKQKERLKGHIHVPFDE